MAYTIDAAMAEALRHLERLTFHFRKHGQTEAANQIGKLSVQITQAVEDGCVNIPLNQHVIAIADKKVAPHSSNNHFAMTHRSPSHGVFQQEVVAALMDEVKKEQKEPAFVDNRVHESRLMENRTPMTRAIEGRALETHTMENRVPITRAIEDRAPENRALENRATEKRPSESRALEIRAPNSRALEKLPARNELATQPSSWAKVASSSQLPAMNQVVPSTSHDAAQFLSPTSMTMTSPSGSKINQHGEEDKPQRELVAIPPSLSTEPPAEEKAGVIRVHGKISKDTIGFITTRIHEGPLQEIRVESNGRARVVFQFLSHALAFLNSDKDMIDRLGYGRLGHGHTVEMAEVLNWTEDFHLMNQPIRERRRLSFARKGLFSGGLTADRWRQDIQSVAGSGNIDFTWVFNTGNATAVFTSTVVARRVLEQVNRWKDARFAYFGVSVTYSSDPCEKELVLVRDTKRSNGGHGFRHRRR
ncbi:hypothetical protein BDV18DRAFT_157872 [Aspergillus unguis]